MIQIYINVSAAAYDNGRYHRWHRQLAERLPLIAQHEGLDVSWWSTRLNEQEASSFVQKDAPLLAISFIFVILYVTVSLSKINCANHGGGADGGGDGGPAGGSQARARSRAETALRAARARAAASAPARRLTARSRARAGAPARPRPRLAGSVAARRCASCSRSRARSARRCRCRAGLG
jgi:hypothetical protein